METDDHPFANSNSRVLLGLSSALLIVFVAFFFIEDTLVRWLLVGVAAVDAVATPYLLKLAVENADEDALARAQR